VVTPPIDVAVFLYSGSGYVFLILLPVLCTIWPGKMAERRCALLIFRYKRLLLIIGKIFMMIVMVVHR